MRTRARSISLALTAVFLASAAGCGESDMAGPTTGHDSTYVIRVITGAGQRAFPGEILPRAIGVEVRDRSGAGVPGVDVAFSVSDNGELFPPGAITDADGRATTAWRLGSMPGNATLTTRVTSGHADAVFISATAVDPETADLIRIRNAGGARVILALISVDESRNQTIQVLSVSAPDSVLRLLPRDREASDTCEEIVAFAMDRAPVLTVFPWTPAIDTVAIDFPPRFPINVTVWIMDDYALGLPLAQADLDRTRAFWSGGAFGVELGEVHFEDASAFAGFPITCSYVPVTRSGVINVYYAPQAEMFIGGIACSPSRIIIHNPTRGGPGGMTLTHELGHTLGLDHDSNPDSFMLPMYPFGTSAFGGQFFRINFDSTSAVNAVFHYRVQDAGRVCSAPPATWTW